MMMVPVICSAQNTCPPTIPHFDFYFNTPVTVGQKVGGVSYCEPDAGQTDVWSMEDSLALFVINQSGDMLVDNADVINLNGTFVYNVVVKITDNGTPPIETTATVTFWATKPNEPPSVLPQ